MNQSTTNPSNQIIIGQASIPMTTTKLGFIHKNDIYAINQIGIIIFSWKAKEYCQCYEEETLSTVNARKKKLSTLEDGTGEGFLGTTNLGDVRGGGEVSSVLQREGGEVSQRRRRKNRARRKEGSRFNIFKM